MRIIELHKNHVSNHSHYVLKSDFQTVRGAYEDLVEESPFGTLDNLRVSINKRSTGRALIIIEVGKAPDPSGFPIPPDIAKQPVDHIIGTKDEDDNGVHYHVMIYV